MSYITTSDRQQIEFKSLDDTITKDNPVRMIDAILENIVKKNPDMFKKEGKRKGNTVGRPEYPAEEMMKIIFYGYYNGISSSRKLETETHRNEEMKWLIKRLTPDYWTISMYRKNNGEKIKKITRIFRQFLYKSEYIKAEEVALDGTKVRANTTKDFIKKEEIEKLGIELTKEIEDKMERYLNRMEEEDNADETLEEKQEEIKQLEAKIKELKQKAKQYEELIKKLEEEGRDKISKTDPESNYMKSRNGIVPAYNVQIMTDIESDMIIDSEVTDKGSDATELEPMVKSLEEEIGKKPEEIIADSGYNNPDMIERVEKDEGIKCYIPNVTSNRVEGEIKFTYNEEGDYIECSEGKRLELYNKNKRKHKTRADVYRGKECNGCKIKDRCTKSKKGRTYTRYWNQQWRNEYKEKMETAQAKQKQKKRRRIEHVMGNIKSLLWRNRLLLRGKAKASIEIDLITTVYNMKRLINIEKEKGVSYLIGIINTYQWQLS